MPTELNGKLLFLDKANFEIILFNLASFPKDTTYYIKLDDDRLRFLKNQYLLLQPVAYYYSFTGNDNLTMAKETHYIDTAVFVKFKIIKYDYELSYLLKKSVLKGFNRVIDDNNYFAYLPKINELNHWDNYIVSTPHHTITLKKGQSFDDFKLNLHYDNSGQDRIRYAEGEHHKNR